MIESGELPVIPTTLGRLGSDVTQRATSRTQSRTMGLLNALEPPDLAVAAEDGLWPAEPEMPDKFSSGRPSNRSLCPKSRRACLNKDRPIHGKQWPVG